jgi:hypothetical protein
MPLKTALHLRGNQQLRMTKLGGLERYLRYQLIPSQKRTQHLSDMIEFPVTYKPKEVFDESLKLQWAPKSNQTAQCC